MYTILELSDAASFLERSREFLLDAEAENNLLLSSAWTLAKSSMTRSPRLSFFLIEGEGGVQGAALNSSERRLLLSTCSEDAAGALGIELARRGLRVKGVLGPGQSAESFSRAYEVGQDHSHLVKFTARLHQKIMRLETPLTHDPSPGLLRPAKEKDFKLLLAWSLRFSEECGLDETPRETEDLLRRYLEHRQLFLWEDRQAVAMAGYGGVTPNGVRVNMVYTDPRFRGRGYAGTLVHTLSRRLLNDGHRFCYLFADAVNPTASRVYERLGYRAISDFSEYR